LKKTIIAFALIFAVLIPAPAFAASGSTDNYVKTRTYSGQFSDVAPYSIFYSNIAALYEYGLTVGKGGGLFGTSDSVTVGQTVVFAARLRSLYSFGSAEAGAERQQSPSGAYYVPYLEYLKSEGVMGSELDARLDRAATRAEVAHVLANALPDEALPETNAATVDKCRATGKFISDVTSSTAYADDIVKLYKCGVSNGNDGFGSFYPSKTITRGALAAFLTRMMDPSLRVAINWNVAAAYSAAGKTWGDIVYGDAAYVAAPTTYEEIARDVNYMLASGSDTLTLRYSGKRITDSFTDDLMQTALECVDKSSEQCYNSVSCTWSEYSGVVALTFSATGMTAAETADMRSRTLASAITVHDRLWNEGRITPEMSDMEKARAYFDWICENCRYYEDTDGQCHLAYSVFKNGYAVCDGYTGAYDLLLKLDGIDCYTLVNSDHAWTVAELDGAEYHIDATWGDSGSSPDYEYFAMSEQTSRSYHNW
jgi:hypothetical protein